MCGSICGDKVGCFVANSSINLLPAGWNFCDKFEDLSNKSSVLHNNSMCVILSLTFSLKVASGSKQVVKLQLHTLIT